nr:MAG TPA: Photosynthetic reaction centre, H-chain N-terminal region [Caudoviricetes sp.]
MVYGVYLLFFMGCIFYLPLNRNQTIPCQK